MKARFTLLMFVSIVVMTSDRSISANDSQQDSTEQIDELAQLEQAPGLDQARPAASFEVPACVVRAGMRAFNTYNRAREMATVVWTFFTRKK